LEITVPGHEGALIAWLYENADVIGRQTTEAGDLALHVRVASEKKDRIVSRLRKAGLPV
jgi:GTP-binding protein HflX